MIKFICFGAALKEFLNPRPRCTRTKYSPLPPHRSSTRTHPALIAVWVPAPTLQMWVPAMHMG